MNLNPYYYMASSASGQDEPNRVLWLATRAGKMEPSCPLGTTRCIPQAKFHQKPYNKSLIDQVCSVKMARYWPRSFFASFWTSTSSRSINTQEKNLANNQPSWPHTWSITHTHFIRSETTESKCWELRLRTGSWRGRKKFVERTERTSAKMKISESEAIGAARDSSGAPIACSQARNQSVCSRRSTWNKLPFFHSCYNPDFHLNAN